MGAGVMNSNYKSEELFSLNESSSDTAQGKDGSDDDHFVADNVDHSVRRRKFPVFKPVAKAEHIRFEKDMLFTSPKQFKDAITDYALWKYCEELRRCSLGSTLLMKVHTFNDGDLVAEMGLTVGVPYFERLYICLEGCMRGILAGCRPIIGLDACHLNTKTGGKLISVVARDPNEKYFPFALTVVMTKDGLSFQISKRDWSKPLLTIGHSMSTGSVVGINKLRKNHPSVLIRDLFWKVAKTTYKQEFERAMNELKEVDEDAYNWLNAHSTTTWAGHLFSGDGQSDTVLNNMCESFNSKILKFRSKPIINILKCIRFYLMRRFQANRETILKVESELCPKIRKRLNKEKVASSRWLACWAGHTKFEVKNMLESFTMDLAESKCSCRKWDITSIPCAHAISCIFFNREEAEKYVHDITN
ncbi:uncharacterized protein LOC136071386 [Quercus suber]|uniref:uncharacterized protein LOC136071386 n=1 Tax=Quercus suber TaxID=58331 RepID=UPI0032DF484C